jgi:hypothetical protein
VERLVRFRENERHLAKLEIEIQLLGQTVVSIPLPF